jgi:hypothetical protein
LWFSDLVIAGGGGRRLLEIFRKTTNKSLIRIGTRTLRSLCCNYHEVDKEVFFELAIMIKNENDESILENALH